MTSRQFASGCLVAKSLFDINFSENDQLLRNTDPYTTERVSFRFFKHDYNTSPLGTTVCMYVDLNYELS